MRDEQLGRLFRMVRIGNDWTQEHVAQISGLSRALIGKHEQGFMEDGSLRSIRVHASALGLRAEIHVTGRGGELPRLTDEEHAAIVEQVASILREHGWVVEAEASYNHFGERGRFDLLAFHPATGTLLVVEVKTEFTDLQALFGSVNVKERLAPMIAAERGWEVRRVATVLAVASTSAARHTVETHPALFSSFDVLSRQSVASSANSQRDLPKRVLTWIPAAASGRASWKAGRRRVRPRRGAAAAAAGAGSARNSD